MDNMKLVIHYEIATDLFALYLIGRDCEGNRIYGKVGEDGFITMQKGISKPLFTFNLFSTKDLLNTITAFGIRTDEDSFIKGKYEATLNHLNDMKKLVDYFTVGVNYASINKPTKEKEHGN